MRAGLAEGIKVRLCKALTMPGTPHPTPTHDTSKGLPILQC